MFQMMTTAREGQQSMAVEFRTLYVITEHAAKCILKKIFQKDSYYPVEDFAAQLFSTPVFLRKYIFLHAYIFL